MNKSNTSSKEKKVVKMNKSNTSSKVKKRFIDKTYKRYGLSFRKVDDRIYIDYIENTRDELNITPTDVIRRLINKELYKK